MKKTVIVLSILLGVSGLFFISHLLITPKPIREINPSYFKSPEQIGVAVYKRLRQDLRATPVYALGSSPLLRDYEKVWDGFLKMAYSDGMKKFIIFEQSELRPLNFGKNRKKLILSDSSMLAQVSQAIKEGYKVIIYSSPQVTSQLRKDSFISQVIKELQVPVISITQQKFAVRPEKINTLQPICNEGLGSSTLMNTLSCKALQVSKKYFRKKLKQNSLNAVMEKHAHWEHLLFIYEPLGVE